MSETCIKWGEHAARVMIESKEIPHYNINFDPEKKEASCWIESQAEKAFSVVWLESDVGFTSACYLYLDGRSTQSYFRRAGKNTEPLVIEYGEVSETSSAPFIFSPLVVTDDDTYLLDTSSHSIGEIKLVIKRMTVPKKRENCATKVARVCAPLPSQKIHEKSKKGFAHRVSYGTNIPTPATDRSYTMDTLETLVTFIFRYRPLEMLRAFGIVPRNPEPQELNLDTPSTSKTSSAKGEHSKVNSKVKREDESDSESDSDSDEDSIREKALLAELEKIRKGKQLKDKRPKKRVKKEEKPVFTPGEIIDLT